MRNCSFTGSIPNSIGRLGSLVIFSSARNSFSGALPQSISNLSSLVVLDVSHNGLSGTIPSLPFQLKVAVLHQNKFTKLPSLENSTLCILTIFSNKLGGLLKLPPMAACRPTIIKENEPPGKPPGTTKHTNVSIQLEQPAQPPVLYAQGNQFSCNVKCSDSVTQTEHFQKGHLLLAPGNQLSLDRQACPVSSASGLGR